MYVFDMKKSKNWREEMSEEVGDKKEVLGRVEAD